MLLCEQAHGVGDGLSSLSRLFGLSCWSDRKPHQTSLGSARTPFLLSALNGVGKIGGAGPKK